MRDKILQAALFSLLLGAFWFLLFLGFLFFSGCSFDLSLFFSVAFAASQAGEFALAVFLVLGVFSLLPVKSWRAVSIMLGAGATLFFLSDYFVYRQFRLHIDMAMLSMFFGDTRGDIFVFPPVMYVQAAAGSAIVVAGAICLWAVARRLSPRVTGRQIRRAYVLILIPFILANGIHAWAKFNIYTPVTSKAASLPLGHLLSANRTLESIGFTPVKDLPRFSAKAMQYPLEEMRFNAPEKDLNLVVIMLDGWRFDMLDEVITPNIYEFSQKAQRFHMHNAASNHTRHGIFSFFYGLPGIYWNSVFVDKVSPVLMNRMLEKDYQTGVFASAGLTSPEFDQTVFIKFKGLDLYTEAETRVARDVVITDKFINFLDSRDSSKPFFSFLFYDCTHAYIYDETISSPKFLPDSGKNYFSTNTDQMLLEFNRYKNSVVFGDVLIRRVLDKLEADNLLDDTVVIITSDHGEEFDDLRLGYVGHNGNFSAYQVQVPLLIYWPGREGADYNYRTDHMDVVPTLMKGMFGCTTPAEAYSTGTDLFLQEGHDYEFMMGNSGTYGIQVGEYITTFPNVGPSYVVRAEDYGSTEWHMPGETYRVILRDLSRFKK